MAKVTINTGNVLNLIDVKKKAGQNVTEELAESIKITVKEWQAKRPNGGIPIQEQNGGLHSDGITANSIDNHQLDVSIARRHDDVQIRMAEEDRKDLKVGVKIFINDDSVSSMTECLESVYKALHTDHIDHVILAYNPPVTANGTLPQDTSYDEQPSIASVTGMKISGIDLDADSEADAIKCDQLMPGIKVLWQVLEDYVKKGRVSQLGVADIGGACLRRLAGWAHARPTIAQISLASCCVVPPALTQFCKDNDVQLLTHADPSDLLVEGALKGLQAPGLRAESLDWCARYQVHIKCRGVLAVKGYICRFRPNVTGALVNGN